MYSALGTLLTAYWGRELIGLNFAQLLREADLRFALLRWHDNAEVTAFYGAEELEGNVVAGRVEDVMENQRGINRPNETWSALPTCTGIGSKCCLW